MQARSTRWLVQQFNSLHCHSRAIAAARPQTWHLLPEPAVLHLLQQAAGALRDRLAAAALVLRQVRHVCRRCCRRPTAER